MGQPDRLSVNSHTNANSRSGSMHSSGGSGSAAADELLAAIVETNRERQRFEKERNFREAAKAKEDLLALGQQFVQESLRALRARHLEQAEQLEEELENESAELAETWQARLQKHEEDSTGFLQEVRLRQDEELKAFEEEVRREPGPTRLSPAALNVEYQIGLLAKQQLYEEAAQFQRQAERLQDQCELKSQLKSEEKIRNLLDNFLRRQQLEFSSVEQRLETDGEELMKMRTRDFEVLAAKLRVHREKTEAAHNAEFIREERRLKTFNASSNHLVNLAI